LQLLSLPPWKTFEEGTTKRLWGKRKFGKMSRLASENAVHLYVYVHDQDYDQDYDYDRLRLRPCRGSADVNVKACHRHRSASVERAAGPMRRGSAGDDATWFHPLRCGIL
jgi:hypothetical protein